MAAGKKMVRVREFIMEKDLPAVEELERLCQAGLSGDNGAGGGGGKKKKRGMSLYAEQIGDPFARVRHAPDHVILVISYSLRSMKYVLVQRSLTLCCCMHCVNLTVMFLM